MDSKSYLKMYIAVLDEVPDFMVPTLVAHSILAAHVNGTFDNSDTYSDWLVNHFRKVVVSVNRKEFEKIKSLNVPIHLGYENSTLNGEFTCAIIDPMCSDNLPNVLKFAKMYKPKTVAV